MIARMFSKGRPIAAWVSVTRIGRSIRMGFWIISSIHSLLGRSSSVVSPSSLKRFSFVRIRANGSMSSSVQILSSSSAVGGVSRYSMISGEQPFSFRGV